MRPYVLVETRTEYPKEVPCAGQRPLHRVGDSGLPGGRFASKSTQCGWNGSNEDQFRYLAGFGHGSTDLRQRPVKEECSGALIGIRRKTSQIKSTENKLVQLRHERLKMINALVSSGCTQVAIAETMRVSTEWVNRILKRHQRDQKEEPKTDDAA